MSLVIAASCSSSGHSLSCGMYFTNASCSSSVIGMLLEATPDVLASDSFGVLGSTEGKNEIVSLIQFIMCMLPLS